MAQVTLQDLQAEQINQRCKIASLYSELLRITPPNKKIVNAAHDWSLRNIETIVEDIMINIPAQSAPKNPYSEFFLMSGGDMTELSVVVGELVDAMQQHSAISTRIEQFGKGLF